jgi:hypothetical protein
MPMATTLGAGTRHSVNTAAVSSSRRSAVLGWIEMTAQVITALDDR